MKTKTVELYEFDELSESAKAKVLEQERYINVDDGFWHKFQIEDWENKLEEQGFNNPKISFSGFSYQGDGASFTCKSVDVEKFLATHKARGRFPAILRGLKRGNIEVNIEIERIDHHYSHEYTVQTTSEVLYSEEPKNYEAIEREEFELRDFIRDVARDLMREIYKELGQEYEHLTSDKSIADTIKANEYTFRANGKMDNL